LSLIWELMLMKTPRLIVYPAVFGLLGGVVSSGTAVSQGVGSTTLLAPPPKVHRPAPVGSSNPVVEFGAFSGGASFMDLQLPEATWSGVRGDGTAAPEATSTHTGIPIGARATVGWRSQSWRTKGEISGMQVNSVSGPKETAEASYARIEGAWDASLLMPGVTGVPYTQAGVAMPRTMFRNVGSGHYVDALIPRLGLGIQDWRGIGFSVIAGMSANATAGYDSGLSSGSGVIDRSTVQLTEYGATLSLRVTPRSRMEFTAARESIHLEIDDNGAYRGLGLTVGTWDEGARSYDLETNLLMAGFRYEF
jgi:hypothetical protein